jgi:hypothetical protein
LFELKTIASNVHMVDVGDVNAEWQQWFMLSGDRHHDSMYCDREWEQRQLEEAKERNAIIIDVGDVYDIMQGKFDPRKDYSELRPEYKKTNYLDSVLEESVGFYAPYADHFGVIALGNHESEVERRMGTNMIDRLASGLRINHGAQVQAGGYTGYVLLRCKINGTKTCTLKLKYQHGKGGNAPVTRGVIATNRMAVEFPDADIVVSGHDHNSWLVPIRQEIVTSQGKISGRIQWHVRPASYKDAWGYGSDRGFDIEKGSPKPVGCIWMRMFVENGQRAEIGLQFTQDVR